MKTDNLALLSLLEEYNTLEARLIDYTRKNPIEMLAVASGVGFALGCFGILKVFNAGIALSLQDNASLKKLFSTPEETLSTQESAAPQALA